MFPPARVPAPIHAATDRQRTAGTVSSADSPETKRGERKGELASLFMPGGNSSAKFCTTSVCFDAFVHFAFYNEGLLGVRARVREAAGGGRGYGSLIVPGFLHRKRRRGVFGVNARMWMVFRRHGGNEARPTHPRCACVFNTYPDSIQHAHI